MFKSRIKNNLQTKAIAFFLLLALVPLGVVGVFTIKTAEDLIIELVDSQLLNVADDKAHLLERWLSERRADLLVISGSSILESMDPVRIASYLDLVVARYQVYKEISVISPDGKVVHGNPDSKFGTELKEWLKAPANELYLSGITLRSDDRESNFRMAAPVYGRDGSIKGVVCATVGTGTILNIVLNVSLGKTGECYLVDKDGTFLAHKERGRILSESIAQSGSFKNIFATGARQRIYLDYRGVEVLGISRKVPGTEWYLVVEQDRNEAFESADLLKQYIGVVMLFSFVCAAFLAWAVARHLVHPIAKLSMAANSLAGGEFDKAAVHTNRTDEIGALYHAFNDMAVQLRERQLSLENEVNLKESELHETDIKLQQSREAAARSEKFSALGRLGAGVAHEIRTPLTSIKLFLESVESEIEISPEYEEDFGVAMRQIKRIETTINRFLDFAKPQELVFSNVDIRRLLEDVLSVAKPMANKQECSVRAILDDDLKSVRGDKKLLEESFINLLVNSLEAMENGGRLEVTAKMDRCETDGEKVWCVRVDVSDTGQGIAEENISNIFDPFFTTKASGTGLGLSLVHSAIQRHGGTVGVRSVPGSGTVFSILLPAEPDEVFNE